MIISHSTLGKNGRLGNQLFQVASTLGLAERYGAQAAFPQWQYEKFFEPIPHGELQRNTIQEREFHHYDWNLTSSCDIMGFLQSEKYFGSLKPKVKDFYIQKAKQQFPIFDRETICLHIRRGDYVGNNGYYQLGVGFYMDALLTHFPNWRDCNILVISDDSEYCKVHWGCLPNVTFGPGQDIADMILASCCDHFIISNSSYGWWCAYLGEKSHSKIVHCGRLHAGRLANKDCKDYYPSRWISFRKEEYKVDLTDMTFTIPVRFDHANRRDNLSLSLCLLQIYFVSNYIVCEQGGKHFKDFERYARYSQVKESYFHRTKMLNSMALLASTPYIANWDADVIIPPMQIYLGVDALRCGADMVYPYDGGFARMGRVQWFPILSKGLDIGLVRNTPFKGRDPSESSAGGAVFWNKQSFLRVGMENQNMISFGPEDGERLDRAKKLDCKVERIGGSLFHMNHWIGENSSPKNTHFNNNVLEQEKVHRMTQAQLQRYIAEWPWVPKT